MKKILLCIILGSFFLLSACTGRGTIPVLTPEELSAQALVQGPPDLFLDQVGQMSSLLSLFCSPGASNFDYDPTLPYYDSFGGAFWEEGAIVLLVTRPEEACWASFPRLYMGSTRELRSCDFSLSELYETYAELQTLLQEHDQSVRSVSDALPSYENNRIIIYVNSWSAWKNAALSEKLAHPERCMVVQGTPMLPEMEVFHDLEAYRQSTAADASAVGRLYQRMLNAWLFYPPDSLESRLLCPINNLPFKDFLILAQYTPDLEPLYVAWDETVEEKVQRAFAGFSQLTMAEFPSNHTISTLPKYSFPAGSAGELFQNAEQDPELLIKDLWIPFWRWAEANSEALDPAEYQSVYLSRDAEARIVACLIRAKPGSDGSILADVLRVQHGTITFAETAVWDP